MVNTGNRRQAKQKRSLEKVERILDAVEVLVTQQTLEALTTTQIAEQTGFAVGTIYQYFRNRTELLIAAHDRMFERLTNDLASQLGEMIEGDQKDHVTRVITAYIDSARAQPGYLALLRFSSMHKPPNANEASTEKFAGDMISAFVVAQVPQIDEHQLTVTRTVVVNIMSVLVDVVLLEKDPELTRRYQQELVAHCLFALQRAGKTQSDILIP